MSIFPCIRRLPLMFLATGAIVWVARLCGQSTLWSWGASEASAPAAPHQNAETWRAANPFWNPTNGADNVDWSDGGANYRTTFFQPGQLRTNSGNLKNPILSGAISAAAWRFEAFDGPNDIGDPGNAFAPEAHLGFAPRIDGILPFIAAKIHGSNFKEAVVNLPAPTPSPVPTMITTALRSGSGGSGVTFTSDVTNPTLLTWGPNGSGTPIGGSATWDLSSAFWTPDGATYQAWPAAGANAIAVFASPDPTIFSGITTNVTISGAITTAGLRFNTGSYNLIISGAGNSLTLATNTGSAPRIDVAYPASTSISTAIIAGPLAGTSGLNIGGYGTLTLSGNNTYTGGININGATVDIAAPGALVSSNTLTMGGIVTDGGNNGGGGTFIYDNQAAATAPSSQTLAAIQIASGDNTVEANWYGQQPIALTFGSQTRAANATVEYYVNLSSSGANGTDGKINLTSQATGFIDTGTFVNNPVNFTQTTDYAWKDSGGFLRTINYGTDPGTATVSNTTSITPGANSYFQMTGNVTAQATATLITLRISGSNRTLTLGSGTTLTVSGLLKAGGGSGTITGGTGIQAANNGNLIVRSDAATDVLTISTPILANGTNDFVKSGPGSVVFNAANTYTGNTYIENGELRLTNAAALSSGSNVQFSGGVLDLGTNAPTAFILGTGGGQLQWTGDGGFAAITNNATVTLNGGAALTWGSGNFVPTGNRLLFGSQQGTKAVTFTNDINLGSAMRTINVFVTAGTATLSGQLTGTGGLTITGGGTITITNSNNSYSGGTNFVAGTLLLASDTALGSGPITVGGSDLSVVIMGTTARTISNNIAFVAGNGSPYQLGGAAAAPLTLNGSLSGGGTFATTGSNTVTFNGNSPGFTGEAELQGATAVIGNDHAFGTGLVQLETTIQGNGTPHTLSNAMIFDGFTVAGSSDLTFTGKLVNDFRFSDTITINNTGATTFGDLDLNDVDSVVTVTFNGTSTNAVITGVIANGFTGLAPNLTPISSACKVTKSGTGTLTLSGTSSTYSGATTISGGVLAVTALANGGVVSSIGQSAATGTNLIINGGTLSYVGSGSSTNRLFQVGGTTAGSTGTLDASGTGAVNFTGTGSLVYGTSNQTRMLVLTGTSTANNTLAPTINNDGTGAVSLTKNGTGTWVVSTGGAYTGATTINAGLLVMNGIAASSAVTVANGGTLGGTGTTGAVSVQNGGAVAPGNGSTGTLNTKNISLLSGGTFQFDIGDTGVGQFDQINVTGTVSLAGNVQISLFGGYTPTLGDKFFVVLNDSTDSVTGTFTNTDASNDITVGSAVFQVNYTDNSSGGGSGNDVSLTVVNVVPEPVSVGLFLIGLAGLAARRRRPTR